MHMSVHPASGLATSRWAGRPAGQPIFLHDLTFNFFFLSSHRTEGENCPACVASAALARLYWKVEFFASGREERRGEGEADRMK